MINNGEYIFDILYSVGYLIVCSRCAGSRWKANRQEMKNFIFGGVVHPVGVVVQFGLRFAPGACEVRGSNPRDPTTRVR